MMYSIKPTYIQEKKERKKKKEEERKQIHELKWDHIQKGSK